jgi:hypothetical protein
MLVKVTKFPQRRPELRKKASNELKEKANCRDGGASNICTPATVIGSRIQNYADVIANIHDLTRVHLDAY